MTDRVRPREIKEGVYIGLILLTITGGWSLVRTVVSGLPVRSILTGVWAVLSQPVSLPLGLLFLGVAIIVPTLLRIAGHPGNDITDVLHILPSTEIANREPLAIEGAPALSVDETNIMLTFASSGRMKITARDLKDELNLTDIRLSLALDNLLNRGLIEHQPANYALSREPAAFLTHDGRAWVVDNDHG